MDGEVGVARGAALLGFRCMSSYYLVDPNDRLDFQHDWSDWLAAGDAILTHAWSITPLNGTSPETPVLTGETSAAVIPSGMLAGRIYHLIEHVTTAAGLEADRTIVLRCENR
jgi:hypothetical protein